MHARGCVCAGAQVQEACACISIVHSYIKHWNDAEDVPSLIRLDKSRNKARILS